MSTVATPEDDLASSPAKSATRPALHQLTGIRFFAALYVMLFHYGAGFSQRHSMPVPFTRFLLRGNLGVALFFTLSGFVLFYNYRGNLLKSRRFYSFMVARLARLYPVYLLAILIAAFAAQRLPHGKELLIVPMVQSWTPAISPTGYAWIMQAWSISVEAFFYCSFPLLLLMFDRRLSRAALWAFAGAALAIIIALQVPFAHAGLDDSWAARHLLLPVLCLPEFILGMILCALFQQKKASNPDGFSNDWITFAGLAPGVWIIATTDNFYWLSLAAIWSISWGIYRLADGKGPLTGLLSNRLMILLGGASYSMYLLQGPMRVIVHRVFVSSHSEFENVLYPFLLIGLSCLVFFFFEEPQK